MRTALTGPPAQYEHVVRAGPVKSPAGDPPVLRPAPRPRFGQDQPPPSALRCPCHGLPLAGGSAQLWCFRSGRSWHADDPVLWPRAA